jgi:hypothetical protein
MNCEELRRAAEAVNFCCLTRSDTRRNFYNVSAAILGCRIGPSQGLPLKLSSLLPECIQAQS